LSEYTFKIVKDINIPSIGKRKFLKNKFVDELEHILEKDSFLKYSFQYPHLEGLHKIFNIPKYTRKDFLNVLYYFSDLVVSKTFEKPQFENIDFHGFLQFYFLITEISHFPFYFTFCHWLKKENLHLYFLKFINSVVKEELENIFIKTNKYEPLGEERFRFVLNRTQKIIENKLKKSFEFRVFYFLSLIILKYIEYKYIKGDEALGKYFEAFKSQFVKLIIFQYIFNQNKFFEEFLKGKFYKYFVNINEKDKEEREYWTKFCKNFIFSQRIIKRIRHSSTMFLDARHLLFLIQPEENKLIEILSLQSDDVEESEIYNFLHNYHFSDDIKEIYLNILNTYKFQSFQERKKLVILKKKIENIKKNFEIINLFEDIFNCFSLRNEYEKIFTYPKIFYIIKEKMYFKNNDKFKLHKDLITNFLDNILKLCVVKKRTKYFFENIKLLFSMLEQINNSFRGENKKIFENLIKIKLYIINLILWYTNLILKDFNILLELNYRSICFNKDHYFLSVKNKLIHTETIPYTHNEVDNILKLKNEELKTRYGEDIIIFYSLSCYFEKIFSTLEIDYLIVGKYQEKIEILLGEDENIFYEDKNKKKKKDKINKIFSYLKTKGWEIKKDSNCTYVRFSF